MLALFYSRESCLKENAFGDLGHPENDEVSNDLWVGYRNTKYSLV